MSNKGLFSLIVPCYNSEEYLKRNLNSILNQTYKNIELILVDDGSTDETKKIIKEYEGKFKKNNIKLIYKYQKNKGLGGAINTGLKMVTGDYFGWINSDDLIAPCYVEDFVNQFTYNNECHVVQCNGYMIPEDEVDLIEKKEFRMINDWNTYPYNKKQFMNMIMEYNYNFTYAAVRTISFDKVINNREIYESRDGQNYQLLLPMFYNYDSYYINKPNCYFVERSNSLSRNYRNEEYGKLYKMYDEYKKIIQETLRRMDISNISYYDKLLEQKYIIKKLEYAKSQKNEKDIAKYTGEFMKKVKNNNIYEEEMNKLKKQLPLVSIVIPVYNGSNYMKEAIDSALNQDYPNIEIIVVNDGSKDNGKTAEIAKSYGNKIKYYEKENGGVSTALNFAIKKMKGEFFSWLSHDDRYYNDKISTQINYLIDNNLLNKKVITYTNYDVIDENSNRISETHFEIYKPNKKPELAMLRGLISGTALLIPKSAFEEFGVFDTKYRCIQDYLLFFNFMKSYTYIHIPKITNSTRVHAGQVTNVNPKVIEENNYLWTMMQEETTDEAKIRLMHSIYDFYMRMERYLRRNMIYTRNDYVGAREHSLTKAAQIKELNEKELAKVIEKEVEKDIYNIILYYYNECHKFVKINKSNVKNRNMTLEKKIVKIINNMGLFNTISYICGRTKDRNIRKTYKKMMNHISYIYQYYLPKESKFYKLKAYYNSFGLMNTLKLVKNKIILYIRNNKYLRRIFKCIRILLKIIFFIPKKIIQFILYI